MTMVIAEDLTSENPSICGKSDSLSFFRTKRVLWFKNYNQSFYLMDNQLKRLQELCSQDPFEREG